MFAYAAAICYATAQAGDVQAGFGDFNLASSFYPAEWTSGRTAIKLSGYRCNDTDPEGRIYNEYYNGIYNPAGETADGRSIYEGMRTVEPTGERLWIVFDKRCDKHHDAMWFLQRNSEGPNRTARTNVFGDRGCAKDIEWEPTPFFPVGDRFDGYYSCGSRQKRVPVEGLTTEWVSPQTLRPSAAPTPSPTPSPTPACGPGKYLLPGAVGCAACTAGKYTSDWNMASDCKSCEKGKFQNITGATSCSYCSVQTCAAGKMVDGCAEGSVADDASCVGGCSAGTYRVLNKGSKTFLCVADASSSTSLSWCIDNGDGSGGNCQCESQSVDCVICDVGQFQPENNQETCLVCPPGKFTDKKASPTCQQCATGSYQPDSGASSCILCAAGTHASGLGAMAKSDCIACAVGRYSSEPGQSECIACAAGTKRGGGDDRASRCLPCRAGRHSLAQADSCAACPAGQHQPARGMAACESCAPGRFAAEGGSEVQECESCPMGKYQEASQQAFCSACPKGRYGSSDALASKQCSATCDIGYYCPPGTGSGESFKCGAGTFCPAGSAVPQILPPGTYVDMSLTPDGRFPYLTTLSLTAVQLPAEVPANVSESKRVIRARFLSALQSALGMNASSVQAQATRVITSPTLSPTQLPTLPHTPFFPSDSSHRLFNDDPAPKATKKQPNASVSCDFVFSVTTKDLLSAKTLESFFLQLRGAKVPPIGNYHLDGFAGVQVESVVSGCAVGYAADDENKQECKPSFTPQSCPGGHTCSTTQMLLCAAGFYCPLQSVVEIPCRSPNAFCPEGSAEPVPVRAGFYSITAAANSTNMSSDDLSTVLTGEKECEPGFKCIDGSRLECEAGSYQPLGAQSSCLKCAPGEFQEDVARMSCTACPTGRISDNVGSIICASCIAGSVPSADRSTCTACKPGMFSPSPTLPCKLCAAGSTTDTLKLEGGSACTQCTAGMYSEDPTRSCQQCPLHATTTPEDTARCSCATNFISAKVWAESLISNTTATAGALLPLKCNQHGTPCSSLSACAADPDLFSFPCDFCVSCPEGASCAGSGLHVGNAPTSLGYWRAVPGDSTFHLCPNPAACKGGLVDRADMDASQCAPGYGGVMCEVCLPGHAWWLDECKKCEDGDAVKGMGIALSIVVVLILAVAALVKWHWRQVREQSSHAASLTRATAVTDLLREQSARMETRVATLQKAKILISFIQCIYRVSLVFSIQFPDSVLHFYSLIGFALFNWVPFLPLGCTLRADYFFGLYAMTLGPIATVVILLLVEISYNQYSGHKLLRLKYSPSVILFLTFAVYTAVCTSILSYFHCIDLEDGESYLVPDKSIKCTDTRYSAHRPYVYFMSLFYAFGTPALYTFLLVINRKAIMQHREERAKNEAIHSILFLWGAYKPGWYLMEVWDMIRKLVLTCLPMVLQDNSSVVAGGVVWVMLSLAVYQHSLPYVDQNSNILMQLTQYELLLTLFVGLLVKLEVDAKEGWNQSALAFVLIASSVLTIIIALCMAIAEHQDSCRACCNKLLACLFCRKAKPKRRLISPNVPSGEVQCKRNKIADESSLKAGKTQKVKGAPKKLKIVPAVSPTNTASPSPSPRSNVIRVDGSAVPLRLFVCDTSRTILTVQTAQQKVHLRAIKDPTAGRIQRTVVPDVTV